MAMKSILFSLYQHFRTLNIEDAMFETFRALRGLIRALFTPVGDATVIAALRTAHCEKCPFYDSKWKTCGTPGETVGFHPTRIKVGCWCYLPLANRDPKKDCYARANDLHGPDDEQVGWPDALRPNHS